MNIYKAPRLSSKREGVTHPKITPQEIKELTTQGNHLHFPQILSEEGEARYKEEKTTTPIPIVFGSGLFQLEYECKKEIIYDFLKWLFDYEILSCIIETPRGYAGLGALQTEVISHQSNTKLGDLVHSIETALEARTGVRTHSYGMSVLEFMNPENEYISFDKHINNARLLWDLNSTRNLYKEEWRPIQIFNIPTRELSNGSYNKTHRYTKSPESVECEEYLERVLNQYIAEGTPPQLIRRNAGGDFTNSMRYQTAFGLAKLGGHTKFKENLERFSNLFISHQDTKRAFLKCSPGSKDKTPSLKVIQLLGILLDPETPHYREKYLSGWTYSKVKEFETPDSGFLGDNYFVSQEISKRIFKTEPQNIIIATGTGSGKSTFIRREVIPNLLRDPRGKNKRISIIVPFVALKNDYLKHFNELNPGFTYGTVDSREEGYQINILCGETFIGRVNSGRCTPERDILIIDEAHLYLDQTFRKPYKNTFSTEILRFPLIQLSGTPYMLPTTQNTLLIKLSSDTPYEIKNKPKNVYTISYQNQEPWAIHTLQKFAHFCYQNHNRGLILVKTIREVKILGAILENLGANVYMSWGDKERDENGFSKFLPNLSRDDKPVFIVCTDIVNAGVSIETPERYLLAYLIDTVAPHTLIQVAGRNRKSDEVDFVFTSPDNRWKKHYQVRHNSEVLRNTERLNIMERWGTIVGLSTIWDTQFPSLFGTPQSKPLTLPDSKYIRFSIKGEFKEPLLWECTPPTHLQVKFEEARAIKKECGRDWIRLFEQLLTDKWTQWTEPTDKDGILKAEYDIQATLIHMLEYGFFDKVLEKFRALEGKTTIEIPYEQIKELHGKYLGITTKVEEATIDLLRGKGSLEPHVTKQSHKIMIKLGTESYPLKDFLGVSQEGVEKYLTINERAEKRKGVKRARKSKKTLIKEEIFKQAKERYQKVGGDKKNFSKEFIQSLNPEQYSDTTIAREIISKLSMDYIRRNIL